MLSLEQKLYQLIINRLDGDKLSSIAYRERAFEFVKKGIGGFILFGGKKDEVKSFIAELQSISETPLFIASDIERGAGQQVNGATRFPCQMAIAAAINRENPDDVKVLEDAISAIADEARDIGINMPLIPVLDVNRNPDNPIICTRAFSDDPEEVSWYGNMYIRTLEAAGRISCAKHFPGHGDTSMDSHIELPVIHKSRQELTDVDLFPFREAVKAGVSSIMIAHLSVPAFDALPATLSEKVITDLLRKELGYEGLVLTDALNMSALEEIEDVPAQCMNAGVDILLHPVNADAVVEELKEAISAGEVAEGKIDAAVERILNFKKKITPLCPPLPNYEKHAELSLAISDKAITLVKDTPGLLPVKDVQDVSLIFAGDEDIHKTSPLRNFIPDVSVGAGFKPAGERGLVIVAIFTSVAAWKGSSGIKDEEMQAIRQIMKTAQRSIVISFGSPYVLSHFADAGALIAAYDTTTQAQLSLIKCLKDERDFQGRLPVNLA